MPEELDLSDIREERERQEAGLPPLPPNGLTPSGVISAIPDFVFAGVFLLTWINPLLWRPDMVTILMLVMMFEFISIHSSAIMNGIIMGKLPILQKIAYLLGFGIFYSALAAFFGWLFHAGWPFVSLWVQVGNRSLNLLMRGVPDKEERQTIRKVQSVTTIAYIVLIFVTSALPITALGITPAVIGGLNLPGSGMWIEQPYRVIAFGFFYFLAIGLSELFGHRWIGPVGPGHLQVLGREIEQEE